MMPLQLQPLSPSLHKDHGWKRYENYHFAAHDAVVPLAVAEISLALPHYPLAFVRREGGGFQLVALLGMYDGENAFVDAAGRWLCTYVPRHFRCYPFATIETIEEGQRKITLCIDQSSGLYRQAPSSAFGEERFFDNLGNPQPLLQQLISFLNATDHSMLQTRQGVDALEAAGLLVPWGLPLDNPEPEQPLLQGLYRVHEPKLSGLDAASLAKLHPIALAVAYGHLFSMPRVQILRRLHDLKPRKVEPEPEGVSLDPLFGMGQDDLLVFS